MKSTAQLHRKFAAFSAAMLISTSAMAYTLASAPSNYLTEQQQGNITYVTGGIGEEESVALENARSNYNVHIMNSSKDGAFSGDTAVVIYDRKGNDLLVTDSGPLLYATLPAGSYTVSAEHNGRVQTKPLKVSSKKGTDLHFVWNSVD